MNLFRTATALLFAAAAIAVPALDFPKYEKVTKGNTTVLLMKQDRVGLVSIRVTLDYSNSGADFSQSLVSLFLHGVKHGSENYPGELWLKTLEATGSELEESVGPRTISLSTEVRKEDVDQVLNLLLNGLLKPELNPARMEQERGRLIAEIESMGDQPERIASRAAELAYFGKNHSYGNFSPGSPSELKSIGIRGMDVVLAHLCPRVIVTVVGDTSLKTDQVYSNALLQYEKGVSGPDKKPDNQYLICNENAYNVKKTIDPSITLKPRRVIIVNLPESQQTQVRMMMAGPTDIYSPLRLAAIPFGGSFTSRLVDELRVKRGLTYSARSSLNQRKLASVFEISSFTKVSSTGEFLKVLFDELGKAKKPGLTAEEIARGKALYKGMAPQRWERYSGLAAILEDLELRGLPADYPIESINRVDKSTLAEANAALGAALDLNHYVLVLAGPAAKLKPIAAKYGTVEVWEKQQVIEP